MICSVFLVACVPETGGTVTDGDDSTSSGTTAGEPLTTGTSGTTADGSTGEATTGDATTGDATTGDATTGDATTDDATTGAGACLEWEAVDPREDPPATLTCGLPELCPGDGEFVITVFGDPEDPEEVMVDDLERGRCMAAALRDRTPGKVRFVKDASVTTIEILGPDAVLHYEYLLGFGFEEFAHARPLRPSEAFVECAEGDARQIWLCLTHALEDECLTGALDCP